MYDENEITNGMMVELVNTSASYAEDATFNPGFAHLIFVLFMLIVC
jgi:hypothetical protein